MQMKSLLKKNNGITLIELLVTLVVSAIVVAGMYRTFLGQQKTYTTQEQVVDMQQTVRVSINRMMTEIRMAGFGNVSMVLPVTIAGKLFNNVVNPDNPVAGALTVLFGDEATTLTAIPASNKVTVNSLTDSQGNTLFDTGDKKYVSIGGVESYSVTSISGNTLTLSGTLTYSHQVGTPVYGIRAVSYQVNGARTLLRDENTGAGGQAVADNIDNLQFGYLDANGNPTASNANIRAIQVTLRARSDRSDPDYKADGGYRNRQIASSIHLKNMDVGL